MADFSKVNKAMCKKRDLGKGSGLEGEVSQTAPKVTDRLTCQVIGRFLTGQKARLSHCHNKLRGQPYGQGRYRRRAKTSS
jgi:hypothetical protein